MDAVKITVINAPSIMPRSVSSRYSSTDPDKDLFIILPLTTDVHILLASRHDVKF
ncbi:hypothetical protein NM98002_2182 [Neisseria meningitidis 98002]|nr:hypothetical protein NM70082_2218 [Neisseria meningitidis 70082]EOC02943.1 hypothetical protein NM82_2212 [Neisseria meningitidis NM82]EOC05183.1 hypothetical protein NM95_2162 [Neisseria meningitidis NM95]EOC48228.1 hypothetical protein NM2005172_2189 [Neisseria meningitidis 2005172]EPF53242.1 hypothetical protein NM98002_2182 [Neisseria meningitidis 98002]